MSQTSLLLSLSHRDAVAIREKAAHDDRTISAYVLRIVLTQITGDDRLSQPGLLVCESVPKLERERLFGPRTVLHIRCSPKQAAAIRLVAGQRGTSISGFVLHCLRRWWRALQFSASQETREQPAGTAATHERTGNPL
jgi:hypothetical protein